MSLESQWQYYRDRLVVAGNDDPFQIIAQGEQVVNDQNANADTIGSPDRINFIRMIEPR